MFKKAWVVLGFFTTQFLIDPIKQKVFKNNKGLEICYGQAFMKSSHKILIANPIRLFLVEVPGSPESLWCIGLNYLMLRNIHLNVQKNYQPLNKRIIT